MLRIRLSRTGKKRQSSFRVVVTDIRFKRDGRIVERIGHYNPRSEPLEYSIDQERVLYWLSVGAQPSDPVRRLLDKQGTFDLLSRMRAGEPIASLVGREDDAVDQAAVASMVAAMADQESEEE